MGETHRSKTTIGTQYHGLWLFLSINDTAALLLFDTDIPTF
jgi:hypothetical protein